MMLQIKFGCNRPAGLRDIHVWKCGRTDARTHGRTPTRLPSYKLTLWAFGSGELKRAVKRSNTSLKDLSKVLEDHGRHSMLSFISSLPISVLRILDTEANKFYDRNHQLYDAALLTSCYTQHAPRPFIDSEINHKRHFIKIPYINKGIEFIDLTSSFKDRSVTSSIPAYFQNSEPPIICYKYNKPIRITLFNFNKLVSDLDIHANTPESRHSKDSKFIYPATGHIMTGNLKIISDSRIRYIVSKGPKYRFPSRIDLKKM